MEIWVSAINAIVSLGGAIIAAWVSVQLRTVKHEMNSRLDALIAEKEKTAKAEGHAAGRAEISEEILQAAIPVEPTPPPPKWPQK